MKKYNIFKINPKVLVFGVVCDSYLSNHIIFKNLKEKEFSSEEEIQNFIKEFDDKNNLAFENLVEEVVKTAYLITTIECIDIGDGGDPFSRVLMEEWMFLNRSDYSDTCKETLASQDLVSIEDLALANY